jgi:hypothetical protein
MAAAHQSQEADLFPTNQLCLGGDLKTGSSSLGILWRHTVVLLSGSSSSSASSSVSATKQSFSPPVAEGEADRQVFSDEELDELVEAELVLPSSQGAS